MHTRIGAVFLKGLDIKLLFHPGVNGKLVVVHPQANKGLQVLLPELSSNNRPPGIAQDVETGLKTLDRLRE